MEKTNRTRIEHDTLGPVEVPIDHLWGAQTQRSLNNFRIGTEKMPEELIRALVLIKRAAAQTNSELGKLPEAKAGKIVAACDAILAGQYDGEFPLAVWQTGSGTQTNMNVNEVIAHLAGPDIHPNDDVNASQSSNDVFPAAINLSAGQAVNEALLPKLAALIAQLKRLEKENQDVLKSGRTHLMDAVPLRFSQEISGWRSALEADAEMIRQALVPVYRLAVGGTAVGTGINCPPGFAEGVCDKLATATGLPLVSDENKFRALTSRAPLAALHGTLKALACDLIKIANDVRWLASGPRCGLGEITIPANEPGSSIMPGKVNPTQCEALTMVCAQVMGNDVAVGFAASQGNFELNVYAPLIAYDLLQSIRLLADGMDSFTVHCVSGIKADREKMREDLDRSLMSVTALSPVIGYEQAAQVAQLAAREGLTLKQACLKLGVLNGEEFDRLMRWERMV
jgi:fumarate hydratase class II